jgi:hypothetical protein
MGKLVEFGRSLFGLGKERQVKGLGIPPRPRHRTRAADEDRELRHRIIALITWGMFTAFALSLLGTVILALTGRAIPNVLSEILFATLGYFGGAFASFMRFDSAASQPPA